MVSSKKAMRYSSTTGRLRAPPRGGTSSSVRASGASNSCLRSGPGGGLQTAPLLDRHQHHRFRASAGYHLGPLTLAGVKQLTEARLGVLNRPVRHRALVADYFSD